MNNVSIAEQLNFDPNLEAEYLDSTLILSGLTNIHFANEEEFLNKTSVFYAEIMPSEYSLEIYNHFFDIFNSQLSFFPKIAIDISHTETGLLHMDIGCDSCAITFEIDTNSREGIVKHREAYKEAKVVSTWEKYPHRDIFLLGKAVADDYFWYED
jgi:hypothetical protein